MSATLLRVIPGGYPPHIHKGIMRISYIITTVCLSVRPGADLGFRTSTDGQDQVFFFFFFFRPFPAGSLCRRRTCPGLIPGILFFSPPFSGGLPRVNTRVFFFLFFPPFSGGLPRVNTTSWFSGCGISILGPGFHTGGFTVAFGHGHPLVYCKSWVQSLRLVKPFGCGLFGFVWGWSGVCVLPYT